MDDGEGPSQLQRALLKGAAALVAICLLVALGTLVMVKALGLDSNGGGAGPSAAALDPQPVTPLPTTALPVPGQPTGKATSSPRAAGKHRHTARSRDGRRHQRSGHGFHLDAMPASVAPMQRINLTGTYAGHDNVSLAVQRYEGGAWTDFAGVDASVRVGTFQTYVMTGRLGANRFRVLDPSTGKASNPVTVTVG